MNNERGLAQDITALVEAAYEKGKRDAHPAIPEEVRETLLTALREKHETAIRSMSPEIFEVWDELHDAARDWLAKFPVASDKAVCPKCGEAFGQRLARRSYESLELTTGDVLCPKCGAYFQIAVTRQIASKPFPPREPKGTP